MSKIKELRAEIASLRQEVESLKRVVDINSPQPQYVGWPRVRAASIGQIYNQEDSSIAQVRNLCGFRPVI